MKVCQSVRKERYDELSEKENELNENVKDPQKATGPKNPQSSKNPAPKSDPNCDKNYQKSTNNPPHVSPKFMVPQLMNEAMKVEKVRVPTTESVEKVHESNPLKPQKLCPSPETCPK